MFDELSDEDFDARLLGGFMQLAVHGCEWRTATDCQFQVGSVVSRKPVFTRQRQSVV